MPDQTAKGSSCAVLQSDAKGGVQFLTESGAPLDIKINGASVWAVNSNQLGKEEKIQQGAAGFVCVG